MKMEIGSKVCISYGAYEPLKGSYRVKEICEVVSVSNNSSLISTSFGDFKIPIEINEGRWHSHNRFQYCLANEQIIIDIDHVNERRLLLNEVRSLLNHLAYMTNDQLKALLASQVIKND